MYGICSAASDHVVVHIVQVIERRRGLVCVESIDRRELLVLLLITLFLHPCLGVL